MKKPSEEQSLIGSFQESGLPEFLKGSWRNANKIVDVEDVGPFPNDVNKRIVVSLTGTTPHTVQVSENGRKLVCNDCARYDECGICVHSLAVAFCTGRLSS